MLPVNADIPFILSRIRPNAEWGWKGGAANDPAQVRWRDAVQVEPTEQEYADEWTVIEGEEAAKTTVRQQLKTEYASLAGLALSALTNAQSRTLLEILVYIMGGIDEETRLLKPANQWQVAKELLKA